MGKLIIYIGITLFVLGAIIEIINWLRRYFKGRTSSNNTSNANLTFWQIMRKDYAQFRAYWNFHIIVYSYCT